MYISYSRSVYIQEKLPHVYFETCTSLFGSLLLSSKKEREEGKREEEEGQRNGEGRGPPKCSLGIEWLNKSWHTQVMI